MKGHSIIRTLKEIEGVRAKRRQLNCYQNQADSTNPKIFKENITF